MEKQNYTLEQPDQLVEAGDLRGKYKPTTEGELPYTAQVTDLAANRGTYTNIYFKTSTGTLNITGSFISRGTGNITARAYQFDLYNTSSTDIYDSRSGEFLSKGEVEIKFVNLDKSKYWFILFKNISDSSPNTTKDISGTFTISE